MDIVRAFTDVGLANGVTINIQGTPDDPLFQANQIGELLGLVNVRESIKDFDEDEKDAVSSTDSIGRHQTIIFLTELGLYRLLGMSRKPFARPFQKWVAKVVKEIRLTGKYEMAHAQSLEHTIAMESLKRDVAEAHALAAEAHAITAKKERHDTLVKAYAKRPLFYVGAVVVLPDGRLVVKYGETDDILGRATQLRMKCGAFYLVDVFPCSQPHMFEQWLSDQREFVTRRYDGIVNGCRGREYLAVSPADYPLLARFIKTNVNAHCGWTIEQQLEKARYDAEHARSEAVQASSRDLHALLNAASTFASSEAREKLELALADNVSVWLKERRGLGDVSYVSPPMPQEDIAVPDIAVPDIVVEPSAPTTPVDVADPGGPVLHLFPPQPKKKMGRPAKAKIQPSTDAGTPLQRFLDECFDVSPDGKTHVAHVRARHRLWRAYHVNREETNAMIDFFKQRFGVVQEMDEERDMTCSFYRGLTMKPWAPPVSATDIDIDAFVREACEVHVMGRARTSDLWDAFVAWKQEADPLWQSPAGERERFVSHMKKTPFVYHTGVPVTTAATGAPGFYGLYLTSANDECRGLGYNRSPNTHTAVLKLDALGNIVGTIESQDGFAHNVAKKSSQHVCKELSKCFRDGMKGMLLGDGYAYMRASDYATMRARCTAS